MSDGPRKPHTRPRVITRRSCHRPHCTKGGLKYRHLMNKFKAKKEHPVNNLTLFDLGFSSGLVNKAQGRRRISITECYLNFKFSGTK